jgi:hypothetical protein
MSSHDGLKTEYLLIGLRVLVFLTSACAQFICFVQMRIISDAFSSNIKRLNHVKRWVAEDGACARPFPPMPSFFSVLLALVVCCCLVLLCGCVRKGPISRCDLHDHITKHSLADYIDIAEQMDGICLKYREFQKVFSFSCLLVLHCLIFLGLALPYPDLSCLVVSWMG